MKTMSRHLQRAFGAHSDSALKAGADIQMVRRSLFLVFLKFLRVMIPYWDKLLICILVTCSLSVVRLLTPWLDKYFVDDALPNGDWELAWILIIAHVAIGLIWWYAATINTIFTRYIDMRVLADLRARFYEHLIRLSMTFLQRRPTGEHMYRSNADLNAVMFMITDILPQFIESVFDFLLVLGFLTFLDWRVTVVLLIYMIPYTMLAHWIASVERRFDKEARAKSQRVEATLQQGVAGQLTVKTYARRQFEVHKYTGRLIDAWRSQMKKSYTGILRGQIIGGNGLLPWLKGFFISAYFMREVILGRLTYGSLLPIFNYMNRFSNPIQRIIELFQALRVAMIPAERILQTLDVAPVVADRPGARTMPPLQGRVAFEDIHFSYEHNVPVLRGLNFEIQPGQKVAFVGYSGAGKSTILNLMLRLYDPDSGTVRIDGIDIREVRMSSLQQQVGLVFQDTYVFTGTVRDNLRFADPRAKEDALWNALRLADLEDFVRNLPNGLDSDLQEGAGMSGGDKQRLGIARALVRNPRLLLLDEPTSSLDSETEARVLETLKKATRGRTTCLISHRMPTVIDSDVIYVMDAGRIVESGRHDALMARRSYYYQLYSLYFTGKGEMAA